MTDRIYFVYRTYDVYGRLLYIGCTNRLDDRWGEHHGQRPQMARATARCRLQGPYTRDVARAIERQALASENPVYGLTPSRQSSIHRAYSWTDKRIKELTQVGWPYGTAAQLAAAEVKDKFPGQPTSYRDIWRPA